MPTKYCRHPERPDFSDQLKRERERGEKKDADKREKVGKDRENPAPKLLIASHAYRKSQTKKHDPALLLLKL